MKLLTFNIVALFVIFAISSCKKSNNIGANNTKNTIQATINGTTSTFNYGIIASIAGTSSAFNNITSLTGSTDGSTLRGNLSLNFQGVSNITIGTYNENSTVNSVSVSYITDTPAINGVIITRFFNGHSTLNPFTIVVTSIDSNSIQGTFQGDIFNEDYDSTQTPETITNGSFNVRM